MPSDFLCIIISDDIRQGIRPFFSLHLQAVQLLEALRYGSGLDLASQIHYLVP